MKEQFGEKISEKDIVESEAKKAPGLELARSKELDGLVSRADEIADDLKNDRNIKAEKLIGLDDALGKLRVNFGVEGETMTIAELKKVPDVAENARIYGKIERAVEQNKANGIDEVTYLTPGIARKLVSVFKPNQSMSLNSLEVMTDEVAEVLGRAEGINIRLSKLNILTGGQLRSLLAKTNTISLRGLDIARVDRDLVITINQCAGRIIMNGKQIDQLKELFPQFKFPRIMGH